MSQIEINLENYRSIARGIKSKVFTGRDRGEIVRNQSKIDELEAKNDSVVIIVPAEIYSINPSFFEEFLFNVVRKLGKENFLQKFRIECRGEYDCANQLSEAIERILRDGTALG